MKQDFFEVAPQMWKSPGWSVYFPSLLLEMSTNVMAFKQNSCNSGSQKSECQQGCLHTGRHRQESFVASS